MTKLCPRGKAAAKRKFKVYPSAYANAYASKICAGKIKDPSGVKRKDFRGPKPSGAKVGMAVTAGSQSATGRLEKSGIKKMMSGGFGIFGKKKKDAKKKSTQEENANKKKKRLEELRKEIGAKKGKMMIMIAIGKPKKANEGVYVEAPKPPKRIKGKGPQRLSTEYIKKKRAYDTLVGNDKKRRRMLDPRFKSKPPQMKNGGDIIKKVASKLEKASKAHAGQAKTLRSIKVRGGGMAVQGMNFKGVY